MKIKQVMQAKTQDQARQYAIDWQIWVSEQSLSYKELHDWSIVFDALASEFDLKEEFKENGII